MSWAAKRRFVILLILGAVVVAFLTIVLISVLYKTPTCSDNVQNQNEIGIDCGGPCPYLCQAQEQSPTVLFTKALTNVAGRTDVVASIENKNATAAAKNVPYRVTLYGANQILLQQVSGTIDLPPGATQTVFIPGIVSGQQTVEDAFLEIAPGAPKWFTLSIDPRIMPSVSNTTLGGTPTNPRVTATLANPTVRPLSNVQVIVLIRSARGDIIAASSTVVPNIPGQGSADALFTWNSAFSAPSTSIQIIPVIPLPDSVGH